MKKIFSLLFVLMFALTLSACSSSDDAAPTYSISGTITVDSAALAGVTVALSGASSSSATTDSTGKYTFSGLANGDYTITPSTATGYTFAPVNSAVTISNANVTGKDFAATKIAAVTYLHYYFPDQKKYQDDGGLIADEAAALFSGYTLSTGIVYTTDASGNTLTTVSGYALDQFVNKATVNAATPDPDGVLGTNDARKLYSVVVRSNNDGFDNRTKFTGSGLYNADLRWDQFILGYLLDLNYSGKTHYPGSVAVPATQAKMYNIKYSYDIYMFRKIDVKKPNAAGTLVTFEPQATTASYVNDTLYAAGTTKFTVTTKSFGTYTNVKAISLDQFLTLYVTDSPSSYTYKIVALDDTYKEGWTYADMQQAYYLPDLDFIIQVDASNNIIAGTKINFPVRIELIGTTVEYDGSANPAPAFASYL